MAVGDNQARDAAAGSAGRALTRAIPRLLGLALLLVVAINIANATGRYLFAYSVTGTDEAMVYIMVWVVMAGAVLSLSTRSHIGVELLAAHAGRRGKHLLHLIHDAAALGACGYAAWTSWNFVQRIAGFGTTSMGLGMPMWIPHAALLAGFSCMTLVAAVLCLRGLVELVTSAPSAGQRR